MSRCCWYTNNKLYISGARIPYHFCFSLLVCFNNGKYFDRFSVTRYTIVKIRGVGRWEMFTNLFGSTFVIFLTVLRFSIFVFWLLVFIIYVFSSWQLTRLDLTSTFLNLEILNHSCFDWILLRWQPRRSVWGKHCWWVAENCDETAVRCSLGVDLSSFVFVALK